MKIVFSAAVSLFFAQIAWADSVPDINSIKKAWSLRQEKARFVSVEWSDLRTNHVARVKGVPLLKETAPEYSHTKIPRLSLLLGSSDGQIRFETEDLVSRVDGGDKFDFKSAFNGQMGTTYTSPREKYGTGTIKNEFWGGNLFMKAPLLIFRPMSRNLHKLDLANYQVLPELQRIDDRLCVVLVEKIGTRFPDLGTTLYLDVDREFLPVKLVETVKEATSSQLSVSYRRDERNGWLPTSWKGFILTPHGQIVEAAESEVVTIRINEPIDDSMFVIKFPKGTAVEDVTKNSRHLIAPDGSRQELTMANELPANEGMPERSSLRSVFLVVNVVLLAVAVVAIAVWRRRTAEP